MGKVLMGLGGLGDAIVYLLTVFYFFNAGENFLALVTLVVPPAVLVTPFLISMQWGLIGLGCLAVTLFGAAIAKD